MLLLVVLVAQARAQPAGTPSDPRRRDAGYIGKDIPLLEIDDCPPPTQGSDDTLRKLGSEHYQRGTVLYEVTQGPYDPATSKHFASWAPTEEDVAANRAFMAGLRRRFEPLLPEISALDQIEAEEDEIC